MGDQADFEIDNGIADLGNDDFEEEWVDDGQDSKCSVKGCNRPALKTNNCNHLVCVEHA